MRFFIPLLLFPFGTAMAQPGCPDPQAINYVPGATANDGSCLYAATNYTLTTKTMLSGTVKETSGLMLADGRLWTHNDSGDGPFLYQVDTLTNAILQTVTIGGATHVDWEDMAFDGVYFYIGDFGNNATGNRTDLKIYKFPLSAIPSGSVVTVPAAQVGVIEFAYEDQTDFSPQTSNNTRFDCEAMVWRNDTLHLFTKDWIGQQTVHYTLPATAGAHLARKREILLADGLITGADMSAAGVLLLLGYRTDNAALFMWLLFDHANGLFFNGNKRRIGLGLAPFSGQVEGLCFRGNGSGYISNEELTVTVLGSPITVPPRLYAFEVAQWLPPIFLPTKNVHQKAPRSCRVSPNPVRPGQTLVLSEQLPANIRVELWDAGGRCVWQDSGNSPILLPQIAPGGYFLRVQNTQGEQVCASRIHLH
ncbi:MAG: T9SS type A sorting domain-containing protein [Lewinellaceae bacterium]|nr:T9SS type A sorting domain-containing protein [Lewinellaceae bacterium]